MNEETNILQELISNVDDLDSRMVYADWLDEQGDPRGEFIRVQCELHTRTDLSIADRAALTRREQTLLARHFSEWAAPLLSAGLSKDAMHFRFGHIDEIHLGVQEFERLRDSVFQLAPLVRRIHLEGVELFVKGLVDWPGLDQVRQLSFGVADLANHQRKAIVQLVQALPDLRSIGCNQMQLGADFIRAMGRSDVGFRGLIAIDVESTGLEDVDVRRFLKNERLARRLRWLNLGFNELTDAVIPALVGAPLDRIGNLRVRGNRISDQMVVALWARFGAASDLGRIHHRFHT